MWGMLAENQLQKDVVVFAKKIPAAITEEANPEFSSHFLFTTNLSGNAKVCTLLTSIASISAAG